MNPPYSAVMVRFVGVHGDFCAEPFTKIGGVADMVKVSMGQNDELEIVWLAARTFKFSLKFAALV